MFERPQVGCGAAIVYNGRILLVRRKTDPECGCWGLPGGKVDLFETAASATQREIAEELEIHIEPHDLLCFVDQIDTAAGSHWVAPVYLVASFTGQPRLVEPDKHDGLDWFPLEAPPNPLTRPTIVALEALRNRNRTTN